MQNNNDNKQNYKQITLDKNIFKAYDIRGIVGKNLDADVAFYVAIGVGLYLQESNSIHKKTIAIGYDGRLSSTMLYDGLKSGFHAIGINVINLGCVPTPMTYFANHNNDPHNKDKNLAYDSSIMITGSHNPPNYNGFKIVINNKALYGDDISSIYTIANEQMHANLDDKATTYNSTDNKNPIELAYNIFPEYLSKIVGDIKIKRSLKVAVDAGNGVAGAYAPILLRALGCEVIELFCDVDGHFPNHHPDPAHLENLQDLIKVVKEKNCDIGIAFDGDGDRLGLVTSRGEVIFPDRQLILYAQHALKNNIANNTSSKNNTVVFDVKCTSNLAIEIQKAGGNPLMYKTGHSLIKSYMREQNALLGGEMSGHIFFADRWYGFDDGMYTASRLIEILSQYSTTSEITKLLEELPNSFCTPELQIDCKNAPINASDIVKAFVNDINQNITQNQGSNFSKGVINTIDGIRIDFAHEFANGFGLVRSSNTTPMIILRFEGENADSLKNIQDLFMQQLYTTAPFLNN
jgi:phosphomannomutase / phosphoglucomutase